MIHRPPDEDNVPQRSPLPTRDAVSNAQIGTLLNVLDSLQPYLLLSPREVEAGIPRELDGGIPSAALSTFCGVCDRIDRIVRDDNRWSLDTHDRLYEALFKTAEKQRETLQAQQDFVRDCKRPSRTHRPEFTRLGDVFVAYYGDLADPPSVVMGRGNTPEEAVDDFDRAFLRKMAEQVRIVHANELPVNERPVTATPENPFPRAPRSQKKQNKKNDKH